MANILIVDDDRNIVVCFRELFKDDHNVFSAYNGVEAELIIKKEDIDIIFLDYRLPGEDGLVILENIKKQDPESIVVLISGHGDYQTIIQSTSLGAFDYIEKPLDIDKVTEVLKNALQTKKIGSNISDENTFSESENNFKDIIGKTPELQEIFKKIGRLVNNNVTVFITGESGTGKELIARALHYNSKYKNEPFIAVNCSGLSESLLDNELFGHEAEAYTDARTRKKGKFEIAGEGTIFLDEIGDMPLMTQSKLLRVLQEKEFYRLGSSTPVPLRARIICATNRNIEEQIENGQFREDLFYRINVSRIKVPPLRDRMDDLPLLVDYFIQKSSRKLKKKITGISSNALSLLQISDWSGNIRELENVIMSICIHKQNQIIKSSDILSGYIRNNNENRDIFENFVEQFLEQYGDENDLLSFMEKKLENIIIRKLESKPGMNKSSLAKKLGVSRITLRKKMDTI